MPSIMSDADYASKAHGIMELERDKATMGKLDMSRDIEADRSRETTQKYLTALPSHFLFEPMLDVTHLQTVHHHHCNCSKEPDARVLMQTEDRFDSWNMYRVLSEILCSSDIRFDL